MAVYKQKLQTLRRADYRRAGAGICRYSFKTAFKDRVTSRRSISHVSFRRYCPGGHVSSYNASAFHNWRFTATCRSGIDSRFFTVLFYVQSFMTFILAMFLGPGLISRISPTMPCRYISATRFSRAEYIVGNSVYWQPRHR